MVKTQGKYNINSCFSVGMASRYTYMYIIKDMVDDETKQNKIIDVCEGKMKLWKESLQNEIIK